MINLGIVLPGSTVRIPIETFGTSGASITATGLAVGDIKVYKNGSTTERTSTSGFAVTTDFDSLTGLHYVTIDLSDNSDANFYQVGAQYEVRISDITVDSQTVRFNAARFTIGQPAALRNTHIASLSSQTSFTLNEGPAEDDALNGLWCIIHDLASSVQQAIGIISDYVGSTKTVTLLISPTFTIAANDGISIMGPMPLQITDAKQVGGKGVDVTSNGEVGIDWGNIGNPTTVQGLSGTTVKTATDVETDTQDIQSRLPAALESGFMKSHIMSTEIDAITADSISSNAITEIAIAVWASATRTLTSVTGLGIATATKLTKYFQLLMRKDSAIATDNATELTEINANGGSGGGAFANTTDSNEAIRDNMGTAQTGDAYAIVSNGTHGNAALKTLIDDVPTNSELATALTNALTGYFGANWAAAIATLLTTQMTESYAADGVAPTLAQALFAIQQGTLQFSISGTTITVQKLDKSTTAMTFTIDSATDPTQRDRAS